MGADSRELRRNVRGNMKAETARLLRAVLRLIEDDVREIADSVVEIDERSASHHARITDLENRLQVHMDVSLPHLRAADNHSRKVPS